MPFLTRTRLEGAAVSLGYSRGQAKRIAARTLARDDIHQIEAAFADPSMMTYSDPTGEEAVDRVLLAILASQAMAVAS